MNNRSSSSFATAAMQFAIALALVSVTAACSSFSPVDESAVATRVATLGESRSVSGMDFSPDGEYLAVAPSASEVQVWDWRNNRIVHSLEGTEGAWMHLTSEPVRYSPNGDKFAVCHSRAAGGIVASIWDTGSWTDIQDIIDPVSRGGCNAIGFAPDGKSLIRALDRPPTFPPDNLLVYDATTWQPVWKLQTEFFHAYSMAISPGGKQVALGGEIIDGGPVQREIAIVDLAQGKIVRTMQNMLTSHVGHLAWSPDGAYIATGGTEGVEIFDTHSGKRVVDEKTDGRAALIRYTPDGRYLIESGFGKGGENVRIWDAQHRELLQEIKAMPSSLAVSGDGHYFAMGGDRKIQIWALR